MQRVRDAGVQSASVIDLVALGFARRESDIDAADPSARLMLKRFGSLKSLAEAGVSDITAATGLEEFEALRAKALIELGRRCASALRGDVVRIDGPEDAFHLLASLQGEKREHFVAILLNAKNIVMRVAVIHVGTLTASMVGAREIFREAIRDGASSIIVAHNHPSGDPTPSPEDVAITHKLTEIGDMLDIPVVDHIIIGERYAISLKEGLKLGGQLGRNNHDIARESTSYARGEGSGTWAMSKTWPTGGEVDPPRASAAVRRGRKAAERSEGDG